MRSRPAIRYQQTPPQDAVAALNDRIRRGEVHLEFEPTSGYLRSVLEALQVPEDSQLLVFSKTSFQARRINPANPRALFFNDSVAIGWVRGGRSWSSSRTIRGKGRCSTRSSRRRPRRPESSAT